MTDQSNRCTHADAVRIEREMASLVRDMVALSNKLEDYRVTTAMALQLQAEYNKDKFLSLNDADAEARRVQVQVINFETLDFDTSADEYAHFSVAFPKEWDEGTVTFQVWWTALVGGTTGVAWGLQGTAIGDNVTSDTAFGSGVVVTDDAQTGALEVYVTAESGAVTIGNTPAVDEVCFFRLYRDVSDANDDLAEDALLIGIKLFFTTNAGSSD